jgi:outer membrane receptor protein involved in Fe transport
MKSKVIRGTLFASVAAMFIAATPVCAEMRLFKLDAQSVQSAISEFGRQADVQIIAARKLTSGKTVKPVQGRMTVEQALSAMLSGTDLNVRQTGPRTYSIIRKTEFSEVSPRVRRLAALGGALAQAAPQSSTTEAVLESPQEQGVGDIIVTAQKRSQSVNAVPMSITAATGEQLQQAGIKEVSDLPKVTVGMSSSVGQTGTPVYTLRGVGYNDAAMSARPAVTVYLDEAPIPFALETKGASLDLERVEVLKGPQGPVFGNNSTGGAINFIAAKPTSELTAGGSFTYGRFNEIDLDGHVSGPLTDTLSVRLAAEHRGGDGWQTSYTRKDRLGKQDFTNMRGSLLWKPSPDLRAQLTINRWIDRSETQAAQAFAPAVNAPGFFTSELAAHPFAPHNDRAADWTPGVDYSRNNRFFQAIGRIDYDFVDALTLTSLTTYSNYRQHLPVSFGGTDFNNLSSLSVGTDKSFSQELRVALKLDHLNAVVGGTYARDRVKEDENLLFPDSSLAYFLAAATGLPLLTSFDVLKDERIRSYAMFGNIEYEIAPKLTIQAGARYTNTKDRFSGCTADPGDGKTSATIGALFGVSIPPAACVTINPATFTPALVQSHLNEDNVSWRVGIQFKPTANALLYANVSKGYKAGGYPSITALFAPGADPAKQESVLAYEAGFKLPLFGRLLQINGAGFYYDYRNKQVTGSIKDPVIGAIAKLVNVPKASITGAEIQVISSPMRGLTLNVGASYLDSKVRGDFITFTSFGAVTNVRGTRLPFTSKWQAVGSGRYGWSLKSNVNAFVGSDIRYQSSSINDLGTPATGIRGYVLTDVQAGIEAPDGRWRAYVWGRNVFNTYYWFAQFRGVDTLGRYAGQPATYGLTLAVNYK